MTKKDHIFFFRKESLPDGEAITAEEAKDFLPKQLKERNGTCKKTLWQLARVYSKLKRHDEALNFIYKLLQLSDDKEENASFFLALGQLMEQTGDYQAAIEYYRGAFSLKPSNAAVWYLVNNNLGFCLNKLKRHREAEGYLDAAVKIDPTRPNAYKNLGLFFWAVAITSKRLNILSFLSKLMLPTPGRWNIWKNCSSITLNSLKISLISLSYS
jgi:tetratricopeptide (TPR) repeat protein